MATTTLRQVSCLEPPESFPFAGVYKKQKTTCVHPDHKRNLDLQTPSLDSAHHCSHCESLLLKSVSVAQTARYRKKNPSVSQVFRTSRTQVHEGAERGCLLMSYFLERTYYVFNDDETADFLEGDYLLPTAFNTLALIVLHSDKGRNDINMICGRWEGTNWNPTQVASELKRQGTYIPLSDERCFRNTFTAACIPVLEIFVPSDSPGSGFILNRPRDGWYRNVISGQSLQVAVKWVEDCHQTHKRCPHKKDTPLPRRVLAIGKTEESIKLHVPTRGSSANYAALSYCWGGPQFLTTTKRSYDSMQEGIALRELPKTIQDAVFIARKLGLQFLWVDALCIIQDDEEDKSKEISQMPQIYKHAYVTLTAASARSSNEGFLQVRDVPCEHFDVFRLPYVTRDGRQATLGLVEYASYLEDEEPLNSRGWTLQESLVSPRNLVFDSWGMRWSCISLLESAGGYVKEFFDDDVAGLRDPAFFDDDSNPALQEKTDFLEQWRMICELYSSRSLSQPEDKLPAMSAIVDTYAGLLKDDYLAGLWKRHLALDLLWFRDDSEPCLARPSQYRSPSWSWTSINSGITWDPQQVGNWERIETSLEILNTEITLAYDYAPYGSITSALLVVRGRLKEMQWVDMKALTGLAGEDPGTNFFIGALADALEPEFADLNKTTPLKVFCLEVVHPFQEGLVLVSALTVDKNRYRRVGYFYYLRPLKENFPDYDERKYKKISKNARDSIKKWSLSANIDTIELV